MEMALRSPWIIPWSIFCQEEISRRVLGWSLHLTVVEAKCATRREAGGEQRRCRLTCSLQNLLGTSLLLQHPCALTSFSQVHPSEQGGGAPPESKQMKILPWDSDKPRSNSPMKELG